MEKLSRQAIGMMVVCGALVGILLGGGIGYAVLALRTTPPEGAEFNSLEDLRRAMLTRDERDVQDDRSVSLRSLVQPHAADQIIYTLRPNLEVKFQQVPVKTNSHGMRSPERPVAKPAGTYRIALLGDSFAFGWGVEQKESFAQIIEDRLNEYTHGNPKVEVLNFGVPGYSTFQEVAQFLETGLQFSPDAVLIYFVENDFGMPFFIRDFSGEDASLAPSVGIEGIRRKLKAAGDEDAKRRMGLLYGFVNANHALIKLADALKDKQIPIYLAMNPHRNWTNDLKKLWVMRQREEIKLVQLREPFMEIFEREKLTVEQIKLKGDAHPNARMHGILGMLMAKPFEQELSAKMDLREQG